MAQTPRMAQIEALLAENPDDVMLRYMLGMEYVSAGNDAQAIRVFQELLAKNPYIPAYHMAAQALNRLGRDDEACEILRQGIAAAKAAGDWHAAGEMDGLLATIE
jgi:predicted Zn-dependent protease